MIFLKKKRTLILSPDMLPAHVGLIMDGNGRWAKSRGLPRMAGHSAGAKNIQAITRHCNKIGIKYFTIYAFSTENWKRPKDEIDNLMNILRDYLKDALANFHDENIKTRFIGDISVLSDDIQDLIRDAEEKSAGDTGLQFNIAVNYGGRQEIVRAANLAFQSGKDKITEADIKNNLYTSGMPDADLIIRPSGEYRLSNFLLWQSAYSEFWYSNVLWPDFTTKMLDEALLDYVKRNRRFGGV